MGKQSRKRKKQPRVGTCTYCGTQGEMTRDHVIPKCLSPKGTPATFIVDACRPCNLAKSSVEDDFRDYLALSISSEGHPYQPKLMSAVMRAAERNRSPLARSARWSRRHLVAVVNGAMQEIATVPNDPEPFLRCVEYIVAGLHFCLAGHRIASLSDIELAFIGFPGEDPLGSIANTLNAVPTYRMVDAGGVCDAFVWWFPEYDHLTIWRLAFFGRTYFLAFAGREPERPVQPAALATG